MGLDRVNVDSEGIRILLKDPGVANDLLRRGRAVAQAAGPGHEADLNIESRRASVIVVTTTFEAMYAEATSRNLTRALDAARR
jgi:hypothetical protein